MIKSVIFSDNIQIQDNNYNISLISTKNYDGPNLISYWINYFIISYINNNINNFNSEIINQYKDNIIYKSNQIINNINNKDNIKLLPSKYNINNKDINKLNDLIHYLSYNLYS
jgi:hypothetical protein